MNSVTRRQYPIMAHDINLLGLDNLRSFIKRRCPSAVPNMERNIAIIKYCVHHGVAETAKLFGLTKQQVNYILVAYWGYAREGLYEKEQLRKALAGAQERGQPHELCDGSSADGGFTYVNVGSRF